MLTVHFLIYFIFLFSIWLISSQSRRGRRRLVSSAVRFVDSIVRSSSRGSPSPSPTSSQPPISRSHPGSPAREQDSEPTSGFRIYNDSLPASSQPQTPLSLPEARHQSRLHGSYTAPLPRLPSHSACQPSTSKDITRNSPGLQTPGFRGLYDGRENSEDSTLFYEASRFREESSLEALDAEQG